MRSRTRLVLRVAPGVLALLLVPLVQRATAGEAPFASDAVAAADACAGEHWIAAWRGAPQGSSLGRPDDAPFGAADGVARTFTDQTLRMVVAPAADGSALRVRFGNRFGTAPVSIESATVAVQAVGPSAAAGSVAGLRFAGEPGAVVPAGGEILSDPLFTEVSAGRRLLVSFHVRGAAVLDHHQWAQATSYAAAPGGDHAYDAAPHAFTEELGGWVGVAGVDVLAPRSTGVVVALGDSITDGIGSSPNLDRRWPDRLNERLRAAGVPLVVVNAGIAGNHVVTSGLASPIAIGPSAVDRFGVDVLQLDGVTDVVLFEGINDVYMSGGTGDIAARVVDGYRTMIAAARAAGVRVIGATLTPASLDGTRDAARREVNDWIRSSGELDAVVDFDAVARDPSDHRRLRPEWDAGMAHLRDDGYAALAQAVPLDELQGTGC